MLNYYEIINFEFQILDIEINTKITTSIWVHHPGQWLNPDTDSNLNVNLGDMEFIKVSYSLIYSLPEVHNCGEYKINSFDYCIRDVSEIQFFKPNYSKHK